MEPRLTPLLGLACPDKAKAFRGGPVVSHHPPESQSFPWWICSQPFVFVLHCCYGSPEKYGQAGPWQACQAKVGQGFLVALLSGPIKRRDHRESNQGPLS